MLNILKKKWRIQRSLSSNLFYNNFRKSYRHNESLKSFWALLLSWKANRVTYIYEEYNEQIYGIALHSGIMCIAWKFHFERINRMISYIQMLSAELLLEAAKWVFAIQISNSLSSCTFCVLTAQKIAPLLKWLTDILQH